MTEQFHAACHVASVNWTLSGDQIFRFYQEVNQILAGFTDEEGIEARFPKLTREELAEAFKVSAPGAPLRDRLRHPPSLYSPVKLRVEAADALDDAVRDIRILIADISHLEDCLGEPLDKEDSTLVWQIEDQYVGLRTKPTAPEGN